MLTAISHCYVNLFFFRLTPRVVMKLQIFVKDLDLFINAITYSLKSAEFDGLNTTHNNIPNYNSNNIINKNVTYRKDTLL